MDPSRFTSLRRCDFARDIPDVYSPSIWAGWYSGVYTEYQSSLEEGSANRVKHFVHIEWGADSHARRHAEECRHVERPKLPFGADLAENTPDSLENGAKACDVARRRLVRNLRLRPLRLVFESAGNVALAHWLGAVGFKDFTTPLRVENPVPRVNQKGVIERDMTKKEGYYVFQSYWTEQPMAHIYGHAWPVRWGAEGEARIVKVYSNCPTAELFVNGEVARRQRQRNSQDFPAAGLRWMVKFAPGKNHLRVVAAKDGVTVSDEIEFEYQTRSGTSRLGLRWPQVARDKPDVSTIEATAVRCQRRALSRCQESLCASLWPAAEC